MNETTRRITLYGTAALVLAGIGTAWALTSRDADVMTLLSSADVQLRLAYGIPPTDQQGKPLTDRLRIIADAEANLAIVERLQPGMATTAEFRGFAHSMRCRFAEAAACYEQARQCADVQPEQADILAFNQARMLAQGNQLEAALAVFAKHAKALDSRFGSQRLLEEAAILRRLHRTDDALQRLAVVAADAAAPPMASLQAGVEYLNLGRTDAAESLLTRASKDVPFADYHLALLKLQRGEVDSSLDLLGRAAKAQPAEVRRRLSQEAAAWSAVAMDARFQEIAKSGPAAPAR
jgi:tetratricopeptide (TPR) repeat protein